MATGPSLVRQSKGARSIRGTLGRRSSAQEGRTLDPRGPKDPTQSGSRLKQRSVVHLFILAIIFAAVSYTAFPPGHLSLSVANLSNPVVGLSVSGVAAAVQPEVEPPMAVEPEPVVQEPVVQEPVVYPTPMPPPEETAVPVEEKDMKVQAMSIPRPDPEPQPTVEPEPTVPPEPYFIYTVQEGDTASALAERFGISTESIVWNNIEMNDRDLLVVGEQIRIPTSNGIIHEVSYGETLTDIAKVYDANVEDIVNFPANQLASADVVLENQTIFVPNGVMPAPPEPEPAAEEPTPEEAPALAESPEAAPAAPQIIEAPESASGYIWPVTGPISSYFGPSHPLGIDIDLYNNAGAPIVAAASGTVLIAGGDPCCSYGLQVLIQHPDGSQTRYGHLGNVAVSVGQAVDQGQVIGSGGCTGYCTGNHLHFEIIIDGHVVDPLSYLP